MLCWGLFKPLEEFQTKGIEIRRKVHAVSALRRKVRTYKNIILPTKQEKRKDFVVAHGATCANQIR